MNTLYLNILIDLTLWGLTACGLVGFVYVMVSVYRDVQRTQRRKAWERIPNLQAKPNLRRVL